MDLKTTFQCIDVVELKITDQPYPMSLTISFNECSGIRFLCSFKFQRPVADSFLVNVQPRPSFGLRISYIWLAVHFHCF